MLRGEIMDNRDFKIMQLFCFALRYVAISHGLGKLYEAIEEYIDWYNQHFQPISEEEVLKFRRELINLIE